MWLGDLVTFDWWNELWLAEGPASIYEYLAVEQFDPSLHAYVSGKARDNPNRKNNETHETVLARSRRSAPPRARWTGTTSLRTLARW